MIAGLSFASCCKTVGSRMPSETRYAREPATSSTKSTCTTEEQQVAVLDRVIQTPPPPPPPLPNSPGGPSLTPHKAEVKLRRIIVTRLSPMCRGLLSWMPAWGQGRSSLQTGPSPGWSAYSLPERMQPTGIGGHPSRSYHIWFVHKGRAKSESPSLLVLHGQAYDSKAAPGAV